MVQGLSISLATFQDTVQELGSSLDLALSTQKRDLVISSMIDPENASDIPTERSLKHIILK